MLVMDPYLEKVGLQEYGRVLRFRYFLILSLGLLLRPINLMVRRKIQLVQL